MSPDQQPVGFKPPDSRCGLKEKAGLLDWASVQHCWAFQAIGVLLPLHSASPLENVPEPSSHDLCEEASHTCVCAVLQVAALSSNVRLDGSPPASVSRR